MEITFAHHCRTFVPQLTAVARSKYVKILSLCLFFLLNL